MVTHPPLHAIALPGFVYYQCITLSGYFFRAMMCKLNYPYSRTTGIPAVSPAAYAQDGGRVASITGRSVVVPTVQPHQTNLCCPGILVSRRGKDTLPAIIEEFKNPPKKSKCLRLNYRKALPSSKTGLIITNLMISRKRKRITH